MIDMLIHFILMVGVTYLVLEALTARFERLRQRAQEEVNSRVIDISVHDFNGAICTLTHEPKHDKPCQWCTYCGWISYPYDTGCVEKGA